MMAQRHVFVRLFGHELFLSTAEPLIGHPKGHRWGLSRHRGTLLVYLGPLNLVMDRHG